MDRSLWEVLFPDWLCGWRTYPKEHLEIQVRCLIIDFVVGRVFTGELRTHALETLKKIPLFAAWDPLALEIYVDCQIYEDKSTGEAKLKTAGIWVCISPSAVGTECSFR